MLISRHSEPASVSVLRAARITRRPALLMNSSPARSNTTCLGAAASTGAIACSAPGEEAVSSLPAMVTTVVWRTWMLSGIVISPFSRPASRAPTVAPVLEDQAILPALAGVFHPVHQAPDQVDAEAPAPLGRPRLRSDGLEGVVGGGAVGDLEPHDLAPPGQRQADSAGRSGPVAVRDDVRDDLVQRQVQVLDRGLVHAVLRAPGLQPGPGPTQL